ncbi:MAG: phosphoribosylformylglycinamidine synthase subunit PurQ [Bacillota bacterium]
MRFAVITFPGSNCDQDCYHVTENVFGIETDMLWYDKKLDLDSYDCVMIPGGFSYGDYLRSGAIARFAPLMDKVIEYANKGGLVIGICNGFQILLEAGLLPGAMKVNNNLKFVCKDIGLEVVNSETPFTNKLKRGEKISLPIAHGEGNYYIDKAGLKELKENNQIVLRYLSAKENPNGSVDNIAGIINKEGNIFGLMPHPERAAEDILGAKGTDGYKIFASIIDYLKNANKKRGEKIGS